MQICGGYLALEREGREVLTVGRQSDKLPMQGEQYAGPTDLLLAVAQQRKQ
jgi:hypothetical protein